MFPLFSKENSKSTFNEQIPLKINNNYDVRLPYTIGCKSSIGMAMGWVEQLPTH
jgi:hypothetical protein